jgi:hypothetical protein
MAQPLSHAELLALWPNRSALARALSEISGVFVPLGTIQGWHLRNSVPKPWWVWLVKLAEREPERTQIRKHVTEAALASSAPVRQSNADALRRAVAANKATTQKKETKPRGRPARQV